MNPLEIRRFPDPALATVCAPVTSFDEALKALVDQIYAAMKSAPGVGITAAHCGVLQRIVVLDLEELGGRRDYINPELLWVSEETTVNTEGSVSMPGMTDTIIRPKAINIRYQDLQGLSHTEQLDGFSAICMQHEIDQLDGIFWIHKLSRLKRDRLLKKWQKMRA